MKAKLQYYYTATSTWTDCASVRPLSGNDYKITSIVLRNPQNVAERGGHKVVVLGRAMTLDSNFLSADEWQFRLRRLDNGQVINLGTHKYMIDYDGLIRRNNIEYHTIRLEFEITVSQYSTYTTWVAG